jgi:hypothetical protein
MYSRLNDVLNNKENNYLLPFYWQRGDHYETIPKEIERIYNSGCRALCVESRPHKDFVGETWWRDMDLILSEAKKRNMEVWLLDDDHFPTGNAAGYVEKYHPDKVRWDIMERHVDVVGPVKNALLLSEERETRVLLGVFAYKRTGVEEKCTTEGMIDLSLKKENGFVRVDLPEGMWRVFFIYKTREINRPFNIDMLSKESVRVLIDAVYESHYEHYKEYFGNTFRGFFSDEPCFHNSWSRRPNVDKGMYEARIGTPALCYPWHADVFKDIEEKTGIDALSHVAAIWYDIGEITPIIRHAYMDAITRMYRDAFTRQLGDWCAAHGVEYIGHIIEDMNAHKHTGCSAGHYFRALDGQHMSGIDVVLHQILPGIIDYIHNQSGGSNKADPKFFHYTLAKLASSFAHIGKDMRERAMCEVFGAYGWAESATDMKWLMDHMLVRGINHFVPHAFTSFFPNSDCPPHFGVNDVDPQFEGFTQLMKYTNKAAHLLYGGSHIADAAILYDAELEWLNEGYSVEYLQAPAKILYDNNIDYDFLPIDCIIGEGDARIYDAEAENGRLKVGDKRYNVLIVPDAPITLGKLKNKLDMLQGMGVKVIYTDVTGNSDTLIDDIKEIFTPDIEITGNKKFLRSCHYKDGANDIYMFFNENIVDSADCTVTLNSVQGENGICLDILNDNTFGVCLKDKSMHLLLEPYQSRIFVFGDVPVKELPEEIKWKNIVDADLNFKVETADALNMEEYTLLKENISAKDIFDIGLSLEFSGRIRYTATVDSDVFPEGKRVMLDLKNAGNVAHLYLNGKDLGVRIAKPYCFDITDKIVSGENQMVIEVSNTLANKVKDGFSGHMIIYQAGLTEAPCFITD